MPERNKLQPAILETALAITEPSAWAVIRISDGMVLGAGKGVLYALRDAHLKVPTMDFGDVAIIYNSESIAPKRAMSLSLVGNREKGELGV